MEIFTPRTKYDAEAILAALRGMHAEVGRAHLDARKALEQIHAIVQNAGARVIKIHGEIVGTYGLTLSPWWFSQEEAYWSTWFYVTPEHRNGVVTRLLLEDIADRAVDEGIPAYIHIYERQKPAHGPVRRMGEEIGFSPSGRMIEIRGADDVLRQ